MGKSCRGIPDYLTLPKVARLPDEYSCRPFGMAMLV